MSTSGMDPKTLYLILADVVLVVHALFIAFVVLGFALIMAGILRGWPWIENFWFRLVHLAAIGVVVALAWCDRLCPLTVWESSLRKAGGAMAYPGTFIQHWLQRLIYYDLAPWIFVLVYTLFGTLVVITWLLKPPKWPRITR